MNLRHLGIMAAAAALYVTAVYTAAKPAELRAAQEPSAEKLPLDYQIYKSKIEPIFLKQRQDGVRLEPRQPDLRRLRLQQGHLLRSGPPGAEQVAPLRPHGSLG